MIPGRDAKALSADLTGSCDRDFNLFFIHSLAPPFLSLVVVLSDVIVDTLGPPNKTSIKTPRVILKAVKILIRNYCYTLFLKKGLYPLAKCPSFFIQEFRD